MHGIRKGNKENNMANVMTAGEIYVITELDPRTRTETDYCKIGIVREKEDRDSNNRAKEHQTSNPRELVVSERIPTQIVEAVETTLHHLYAPKCISGEWFHMTQPEREAMVKVARGLATEAEVSATDMKRATDLRGTASNGEVIEANEEATTTYGTLVKLKFRVSCLEELKSTIAGILATGIKEEGGRTKVGSVRQVKGREVFDERGFAAAFPGLVTAFTSTTSTVVPRFTLAKSAFAEVDADVQTLRHQVEVAVGMGDNVSRTARLHELHLQIVSAQALAAWGTENATARIQVLCGEHQGIAGVCTWKREVKTKSALDRKALKLAHPDEYSRFVSIGAGTEATFIARDLGFEH